MKYKKEKTICPSFGNYDKTDGQCRVCSRNDQRKKLFSVCKENTKVPNISAGNGKQIIIVYNDPAFITREIVTCSCYSPFEDLGTSVNQSVIHEYSLSEAEALGWVRTNYIMFCPIDKSYVWICPDCAEKLKGLVEEFCEEEVSWNAFTKSTHDPVKNVDVKWRI